MGIGFDINDPDTTVVHGLGTRDILVQAWQNGHLVIPDVAYADDAENEIRVFAHGVSEKNPLRLLVLPIGTGYSDPAAPSKPSEVKSNASSEEKSKPKRTRTRKSKAS